MEEHHDHTHPTHTAGCDSCAYVAQVHAHGDDEAVSALAEDLAAHNKEVHGTDTPPETIKDPIRAKMQTVHEHQG